ncbi:carbonic anhydrase [Streptoalloteichus tenebrarius]|uniref:carbonic anhydrase n=1 Tax=Streptoalloteichus tenebrarius (strain ATCC 17920 / DSM 40477 / JCM 4838 / CBS 697.72 / NBRC 16177 / NCIMB 11028 / NRRL B-12390 / A12253. 1 / ISP 5477) TaxID=1933 RepID=A0ABT1I3A1_STRSD|nr:carbonic anhydrase [Streptoalloteichus tenebrarius]MCP2262266.1 carbonic anhydrase [Streptoalloteichus tenebrarius]
MTAIEELLQRHAQASNLGTPTIQTPMPSMQIAIVTCMDARIKVFDLFGLKHGEAHILRNAGGVVTDDVIRSLALSQRKLGTREIIIVQHTQCGLSTITDDEFRDELEKDSGLRPTWAVEAFREVKDSVRQSVQRARRSPFLPHTDNVRGFVLDVTTGSLTEVL